MNLQNKKLTAEQLQNLSYGDAVYKFQGVNCRKLRFVGKMPGNEAYLIFCEGEHLEHLYIHTDKTFNVQGVFRGDFYSGDLTSEDIGKLTIEYIDAKIEDLKRDRKYTEEIYFRDAK